MIQVNSPTQPVTFFILSQGKFVRLRRRSSYVVVKGYGFVSYVNLFQDQTPLRGKPCLLARLEVEPLDLWMR